MKKLDLAQFAKKDDAFAVLWWAFRAGYPKRNTGYDQLKLLNRIGEKLEGISVEKANEIDQGARVLNGKSVLLMPEMEFDLLLAMLKSGPPTEVGGWTHVAGRVVEVVVEAMEKAEKVEVEEKGA
jgi:hypothetical protein